MLRVKDWDLLYENAESRSRKTMQRVRLFTKFDGTGYTTLLSHPRGAELYAAWVLMLACASKCPVRGLLRTSQGIELTSRHLAAKTRVPQRVFDLAIPKLIEIGWLEEVTAEGIAAEPVKAKDCKEPDAWCLAASKALLNRVRELFPKTKDPNLNAWADSFRLLLRDGNSKEEVKELCTWLFTSRHPDAEFWKQQVRSPDNLRKHWATVHGKMRAAGTKRRDKVAELYKDA